MLRVKENPSEKDDKHIYHMRQGINNKKTLILKCIDLEFNDKECMAFTFIDITAYERLQEEKELSQLFKSLNTTVHHEMMSPL